MLVTDIKKINVRSPYYISVSKDETADTAITEPQVSTETLVCGGTASAGISVGTRKFNIDISDRIIGDFTVTISGVRVPIRYRLGYAANMPSFATIGLDDHQEAWTSATGETTGLASSALNPNGASVDAVYTSTQSDIDTYGTTIQLEIQQPLPTDGWSATLACPVRKNDADAVDGGFVTIINIYSEATNAGLIGTGSFTINDVALGQLKNNETASKNIGQRFIMSDISPNLVPEGFTSSDATIQNYFYNPNEPGFNYRRSFFKNTAAGKFIFNTYKGENVLGSGVNILKFTQGGAQAPERFTVHIARHPVVDVGGTLFIQGNDDGIDITILECSASVSQNGTFSMEFNGSNSVELAGISASVFRPASGLTQSSTQLLKITERILKGV